MLRFLATWRCRFRWPPKHNWTRQKLEDGHAYFLCSRCLKVKDPMETAQKTTFTWPL